MLTPRRKVFDALPDRAIIIDVQTWRIDGRDVECDALGRAAFTAFWATDQGWVSGGVRAQVFCTDLAKWVSRHEDQGAPVFRAKPCSYPGCGKPTAYLPHADNGQGNGWGEGWRHLNPDDEADTHVGYPMDRAEAAR